MRYFLLLLPFAFLACNHKYYAPNKVHTPILKQEKDWKASVGAYTADEFSGFNIHASTRVTHNFVAGANIFTASSNRSLKDNDGAPTYGGGFLGEVFMGPYFQANEHVAFSFLMGGGFGRSHNVFGWDKAGEKLLASLNFQRQFIQPTVTLSRNRFSLGAGMRFCRLDYTSGRVSGDIVPSERSVIQAIDLESPFYLPEIGINLGFVGKRFAVEYSITNLLYQKNYDYRFADRTIGLDVVFDPSFLWRKKNRKK